MMKKNVFIFGFLLLSGIVVLAYAAGKQSNRLSEGQMNFDDKVLNKPDASLTAKLWDTMLNGVTIWVKNHEERLSVYANTSGYPNLTEEEMSFTNLLSTRNNNMLTTGMWNGLVNKLTMVVTNHEMRLRAIKPETPPNPGVQKSKCYIKPDYAFQCKIGDPIAFGKRVNKWSDHSFLQVKRKSAGVPGGKVMYYGYNRNDSFTFPTWYDHNLEFIDFHSRIPDDGKIKMDNEYEKYDFYAKLADPYEEKRRGNINFNASSFDTYSLRVYEKREMTPHWNEDAGAACYQYCGTLSCSCRDRISSAGCKGEYNKYLDNVRKERREKCEAITDPTSCSEQLWCQWIEI